MDLYYNQLFQTHPLVPSFLHPFLIQLLDQDVTKVIDLSVHGTQSSSDSLKMQIKFLNFIQCEIARRVIVGISLTP